MHVSKSGTFYDIYVKNDYFYKKVNDSQSSDSSDFSIDDYMNKVHTSVAELKNVSIGDVQIHVLPESSTDKSSSATEDVSDDIIGVVTCKYHYEADETAGAGAMTSTNMQFDRQYDKVSAQKVLDKLKSIYSEDSDLNKAFDKYSDPSKYETRSSVNANGETVTTLARAFDPFGFEIAELNAEIKYNANLSQIFGATLSLGGDNVKQMLKKLIEDMKKNNEDTLLNSNASSTRLSSIFQSLQEEKKKTNQ